MKKILLVEDDPFLIDIYTQKLKKAGFKVEVAKDGEAALRMVQEKKPDLLLLDIVLPEIEGWEILRKIKEDAKLCDLKVGDTILDIVGPLGEATKIHNVGTILACGGGVGVAPMLPIVDAFKKAGNRVISIIAARTKDLIILENEIREHSDELIIMTDDGSYGKKGLVTKGIEDVIAKEKVDEAIVIGPAIMMKYAALTTKEYNIPTQASLNTIMVDGTGMCGACRVTVDG